ncbi:MAG TPA: hypothetical protein VKV73_07560 [Chloroflexota bacterium]|nr:hypothetical protein [Chloroflexota bacterium]
MDLPIPSSGTLQPRYRRVLSFGDVLDESIRLFRQHWSTFALVSAVAFLVPGLLTVALSAYGLLGRTNFDFAELSRGVVPQSSNSPPQLVALTAAGILSGLFYVIWSAAVTAATEVYMRGGEPKLSSVYRRALRRFFTVLIGTIVLTLGVSVLTAIAVVLFVITLFGILGIVVALVALLIWWLSPGARKPWVRWLVILAMPFGLPTYYGVRWSLFVAAAVLERRGPIASLVRSSELVERHFFRVLCILTVSSVIVGVLLYAPAALIEVPLLISSASRGQLGVAPIEAAIINAVTLVLRILVESVGVIVYTVMFIDLRNRREGTDMAERLTQLEALPVTPGG